MYDLLNRHYIHRLQLLRERMDQSIRNMEINRTSLNGPVILPEPESHRPYSPGDNPAYIDWNLFARTDRFFVKSMLREEEGIFNLLVDTSNSMVIPFPQKMECALQVSGAMAYLSLCAGNKVRLYSMAQKLSTGPRIFSGETEALDMLRNLNQLAQNNVGEGTNILENLAQLLTMHETENSWILLVSDLIDLHPYKHLLEILRQRSTRFGALQILHSEEQQFTGKGNFLISDPESSRQTQALLGHRSLKELRKLISTFLEEVEKTFRDREIEFARTNCDRPFEGIILDLLSGRQGSRK